MARILLVQLGRLGDVIQTTPLIRELADSQPQDEIDLLLCAEFKGALDGLGGLRNLYTLPISWFDRLEKPITEGFKAGRIPDAAFEAFRELALPHYDRVISCSTTALACWITGQISAGRREGGVITPRRECLFFGDHHVYVFARQFFREQNWLNLVDLWRCAALNRRLPDAASRPYVAMASELPFALPPGRRVALNPGSAGSHRRWTAEHFARVAEGISRQGATPLLVGAPADEPIGAAVVKASSVTLPNFCGRTSIPQMARLLEQVDVLVSADTGAVHMAAAAGARVVGIYGATAYFAQTAPWSAGHLIFQMPAEENLADLRPEWVVSAALNRLGLLSESQFRAAIAPAGVQVWETRFLPPEADPLGGLTYRPLHSGSWRTEDLLTRALRHVFAASFCRREAGLSLAYLGDWLEGQAETGDVSAASAPVIHVLAQMAAAAARCRRLALQRDRRSQNELSQLTAGLAQGLEELKKATERSALKPVIQFLDWKLRMISPPSAPEAYRGREVEYRRAAAMIRQAADLVDNFRKASAGGAVTARGESIGRKEPGTERSGGNALPSRPNSPG